MRGAACVVQGGEVGGDGRVIDRTTAAPLESVEMLIVRATEEKAIFE